MIKQGRWSYKSAPKQNLPKGRQIPILSRTGRIVGHCTAPEVYTYA